MAANKGKDILAELLSGHHEDVPEAARLEQMIKSRITPLPDEEEDETPGTYPSKIKATHYLAPQVASCLDEIREVLAEFLPSSPGLRVTKSRIVNAALRLVLRDVEKRGRESALVRYLIREEQLHSSKEDDS